LEDEEIARKMQRGPQIPTPPVDPDELLARQLEIEERNSRQTNFRMRGFPGSYVSYQPESAIVFGGSEGLNDSDIARRFQAAEFGARRREATPFPQASFPNFLQNMIGMRRGRGNSNINPALLQLSLMGREFTDGDYEMLLKLDEQVENRKGAKKNIIEKLPTFTVEKEDQVKSCCVCLCETEIGSEVRKLPCGHYFHVECIDKWLELNKTCPIDKKEV